MNSEAARVIDAYFEELEAQRQRHKQNVREAIEKQKRRKQMLKDMQWFLRETAPPFSSVNRQRIWEIWVRETSM